MKIRLAGLDSKYRKWEIAWKAFDFGQHKHAIDATQKDIQMLATNIKKELKEHKMTDEERKKWSKRLKAYAMRSSGNEVVNWDFVPKLDVEFRFSVERPDTSENFQLRVPYHKDIPETHTGGDHIQTLILERIAPEAGAPKGDQIPSEPEYKLQNTTIARTRPLGTLFRMQPALFQRGLGKSWKMWRLDRRDIVRGLLHWNILLWGTAWMEQLCSCGIQVEKDPTTLEIVMQVLNTDKHFDCEHSKLCLRNLGIVLAEIVLATSLQTNPDDKVRDHKQWVGNGWKAIKRGDIYDEVLTKTGLESLRRAVHFCLEEDLPMATEEFKAGFVYRCNEKI
ncbi:hypothetical protein EK21DRAFT_91243 [Setomelanomma holmii]|uniref:Uncharacterized protein n=1 Tax=Setomelanomma holmii TaxID=210430 RepID=A0A9P4H478_9PLEO|nr:hypothetical protein EK21DRAFT_91243 [Setomelanomma holmii]